MYKALRLEGKALLCLTLLLLASCASNVEKDANDTAAATPTKALGETVPDQFGPDAKKLPSDLHQEKRAAVRPR